MDTSKDSKAKQSGSLKGWVGRRGPVTEPFSFTSAFDPRQFQLSLRLNF